MGWAERAKRLKKASRRTQPQLSAQAKLCSGFDLGELKAFSPAVFDSPNHDLDAFVLMLALAFNDFKTLSWLLFQLDEGKPSEEGISGYNGQWHGIKIHTHRLLLALLCELLVAVKENEAVINSPEFRSLKTRIPEKALNDWDAVAAVAFDQEGSSDQLVTFLKKVRNNFAFHYYQPKALHKGYRHYFFEREPSQMNARAYVSLGDSIEKTRYYFADAAVQAGIYGQTVQEVIKESGDVLKRVYAMLRFVVAGYLTERQKALDAGA